MKEAIYYIYIIYDNNIFKLCCFKKCILKQMQISFLI